jgi:hypothetical protein
MFKIAPYKIRKIEGIITRNILVVKNAVSLYNSSRIYISDNSAKKYKIMVLIPC